MRRRIYRELLEKKSRGYKSLAVLIDPDHFDSHTVQRLTTIANESRIDYFLVGGSLVSNYAFKDIVGSIKESCEVPVIIFPGNYTHIEKDADAILFLSLISGRNPDLLIGQHVVSAPIIKASGLEAISTGYMLVDGGKPTTASYMSGAQPIPADKPDIAKCTAIAGEMLGLQMIYLDAGSGALNPVSMEMIRAVSGSIEVPLIIGGGVNTLSRIDDAVRAGADVIVIGNGIEKSLNLAAEASEYFLKYNGRLNIN